MTNVLYVSPLRVIWLKIDSVTWRLGGVFDASGEGVAAFENWLATRRRRSVVVLLDLPDDVLDLRELPRTNKWQQAMLNRKLDRLYRSNHALCGRSSRLNHDGQTWLRQLAFDRKIESSKWYSVLVIARTRLSAIYPVVLLAEKILASGQTTGAVLQASVAENRIRHSCFQNGQLCFTRSLDGHQDSALSRRQLSDTRLYLQEQFSSQHGASLLAGDVACSMADDISGSGLSVPANAASSHDSGELVSESLLPGISQSQAALFDFLARQIAKDARLRSLVRYQMTWRQGYSGQGGLRQFWLWASLILVAELSVAVGFAWRNHTLQSEIRLSQNKLEQSRRQIPDTDVSADVMRDYVLLTRSVPKQVRKPDKLLRELASSLREEKRIVLTGLQWSFEDSPVVAGDEVAPKLRNKLLVRNDGAPAGAALVRVTGFVTTDGLSIDESYRVCQRFVQRIKSLPGWELLVVESMPFDSDASKSAGSVFNRHKIGRFSLLTRSLGDA